MRVTSVQGTPYGGLPHIVVIDSSIRYVCLDDKSIGSCACGNSIWVEVPCPYCHTEGEHDCSEVSVPYVKYRFGIQNLNSQRTSYDDIFCHYKALETYLYKELDKLLLRSTKD